MKNEKEQELLMLILNECSEEEKNKILSSPESCRQLTQLEKDMETIQSKMSFEEENEDYGHQLWNEISNKLELEQTEETKSWFQVIQGFFISSKLKLASTALMVMFCFMFFLIGYNTSKHNSPISLDNNPLLARNIQLYLTQAEVYLTNVSMIKNDQVSASSNQMANQLLAMNRIYKSALQDSQDLRVKNLLTELDLVLTELSNKNPEQYQEHIFKHTNDHLINKVKFVNKKLDLRNETI